MVKKVSAWDYLWYALYAFAALGVEFLLLGVLEPIIFATTENGTYTPAQTIIHWILTMTCWGTAAILLILGAKKQLGFSMHGTALITRKGVTSSMILIAACIALKILDCGTLKVINEFQKNGLLLFLIQQLYYFFEVLLVLLIVAFGQRFIDGLLKRKSRVPWGGILLCCTWGAIHFLSKGSITTEFATMFFSLAYGMIYLCLNRNTKYAYIVIAIAFIV